MMSVMRSFSMLLTGAHGQLETCIVKSGGKSSSLCHELSSCSTAASVYPMVYMILYLCIVGVVREVILCIWGSIQIGHENHCSPPWYGSGETPTDYIPIFFYTRIYFVFKFYL